MSVHESSMLRFNSLPMAGDLTGVLAGTVALAVTIVVLVTLLRQRSKYANLPPAVKMSRPPPHVWRHYLKLSRQYGPVFTLWEGATPKIIINDMASRDYLLEKHARDSPGRPEILTSYGNGLRGIFVDYSDTWRNHRKAHHVVLQPSSAREHRPFQEKNARLVIADIVQQPDKYVNHIETYNATIAQHLAYGLTERQSYQEPHIQTILDITAKVGLFTKSNGLLLESYPWLKYIPFYKGIQLMRELDRRELELYYGGIDLVKQRMAAGTQEPCFATYLVENQKDLDLSDEEVANLAGTIFAAASDTTTSGILSGILAAATHPEMQKRVQAELDAICPNYPPTFADIENPQDAPFLHAWISEVSRWRPVNPSGFAHKTIRDIPYENYVIPAGTSILGNHWSLARDASYYGDNVEDFVIDRFLTPEGKYDEGMKNIQFGFGRRACPGVHIAMQSLKMNTALLLWSFNIGKKVVNGQEVEIDTLAYTDTGTSHPLPFEVQFTPRRAKLEGLMRDDGF